LLKPLGFPLNGMPGVMGGTIRPDGSVQIVLDVVRSAFRPQSNRSPAPIGRSQPAIPILVADDSPTTRSILRNVFSAAGYAVRTAVDGIDALEQLRAHPVQLVVTDLEMPRLNGFELTRQVKSQFGLPVVLVTGLEREDDRRQGLEAGADAYVVKSTFHGEGLLEIVRQLVGP
jgi:two-component system chemotaxis sensor kinase CheA